MVRGLVRRGKQVGDNPEGGMKYAAAIVIGIGNAALAAFVLTKAWLWFVVPLGVVEIGYWHAMGVSVVASWLTHQMPIKSPETDADDHLSSALARLLATFVIWGGGALIHGQMVPA